MAAKSDKKFVEVVIKEKIDEEVVCNFINDNYEYLSTEKGEDIRILLQTTMVLLSEQIPEWMKEDVFIELTAKKDYVIFRTSNNNSNMLKISWKRGSRDRIIEHVKKSDAFRRQQQSLPFYGHLLAALVGAAALVLAAAITGPLAALSLSALGASWASVAVPIAAGVASVAGVAAGAAAGYLAYKYDAGNMIANGKKTLQLEYYD